MKCEKSQDLPSASWRSKKADEVVVRPESQRPNGEESSPGLKGLRTRIPEGRRKWMPQLEQSAFCSITLSFVLFRPSMVWMIPSHFEKDHLLHSIHQFKC